MGRKSAGRRSLLLAVSYPWRGIEGERGGVFFEPGSGVFSEVSLRPRRGPATERGGTCFCVECIAGGRNAGVQKQKAGCENAGHLWNRMRGDRSRSRETQNHLSRCRAPDLGSRSSILQTSL